MPDQGHFRCKLEVAWPVSAPIPDDDDSNHRGRALLKSLCAELRHRGVPRHSYIMVNLANGRFVTAKTADEALARFESLHPGTEGWLQRFGAVLGDPDVAATMASAAEFGVNSRSCRNESKFAQTRRNRSLA
jgi:hypothetical protein